jgi:galactokinase
MAGDAKKFGELMSQAHKSMKDDFAASCTEVDVLVEIALQQHECFGARITGGGFGGCTVNLVRADAADSFVETLKRSTRQRRALRQSVLCPRHRMGLWK